MSATGTTAPGKAFRERLELHLQLVRLGDAVASDLPRARKETPAIAELVAKSMRRAGADLADARSRWHALVDVGVRELGLMERELSELGRDQTLEPDRAWRHAVLIVIVGVPMPHVAQLRYPSAFAWKISKSARCTRSRRTVLPRCLRDVRCKRVSKIAERVTAGVEATLVGRDPEREYLDATPKCTRNTQALEMLRREPELINAAAAEWAKRLGVRASTIHALDAWMHFHESSPVPAAPWWDAATVPEFGPAPELRGTVRGRRL